MRAAPRHDPEKTGFDGRYLLQRVAPHFRTGVVGALENGISTTQTDTQRAKQTETQPARQTETDRQTDRQTDTDRQTGYTINSFQTLDQSEHGKRTTQAISLSYSLVLTDLSITLVNVIVYSAGQSTTWQIRPSF